MTTTQPVRQEDFDQQPDRDQALTTTAHRAYRVIDVDSPVQLDYRRRDDRPIQRGISQAQALLGHFPGLRDATTLPARLFLILVGFLPVTLIAASTFGVVGLRDLARFVLVPAIIATALLLHRYSWARRLVGPAMVIGAVATGGYDLIRFGFIWTGLMHHDPIPHIGADLHLHPAWMVGYLWRYSLNGAGLSIAFFSLGLRRIREGLLFGFFVATGLIFVLIVSPHAAQDLWAVNATSVSMIVSGHLAFGAGLATIRGFLNRRSEAVR